jgi:hypothetical protein
MEQGEWPGTIAESMIDISAVSGCEMRKSGRKSATFKNGH